MAKKSITDKIIETADLIEDDEQRLNALLSATHSLEAENSLGILDAADSIVEGLVPAKKVIWLARLHQHQNRINKLMTEARNG